MAAGKARIYAVSMKILLAALIALLAAGAARAHDHSISCRDVLLSEIMGAPDVACRDTYDETDRQRVAR
jgi:hypothetical protein